MTSANTSGLQLAGLAAALALYAGILGYLQVQGTESLDPGRHGEAVNAQLQSGLQRSESDEVAPAADSQAGNPEGRVVRPFPSGIFGSALPRQDEPPARTENADYKESATAQASIPQSARAETLPQTAGYAVVYPAVYPAAYGYGAPVYYPPYAKDRLNAWGQASHDAYQGYYGNHRHVGRGDGRAHGRGRGTGSGEGEFSFHMRFVSRLRADADIDADSDWDADSHGWQDFGNGYQGRHYQGAQAYYSTYR